MIITIIVIIIIMNITLGRSGKGEGSIGNNYTPPPFPWHQLLLNQPPSINSAGTDPREGHWEK